MQNRRIAVRGIIVKDKKILCVRLNNYKGNAIVNESEFWCTPGGGVDIGEPLIPTLEREMIEERVLNQLSVICSIFNNLSIKIGNI